MVISKVSLLVLTAIGSRSSVYEIDVLNMQALPQTIETPIRFHNVLFNHNTLHLFAPSQKTRRLLTKLPSYKIYKNWKIKRIDPPRLLVYDHEYMGPSCDRIGFFYSPWVQNNMFHLHNDNIIPLIETIRNTPDCSNTTLKCNGTTTLYSFDYDSYRKPVAAANALSKLFDRQERWASLQAKTCFKTLVWGRGRLGFYDDNPDVVNSVKALRKITYSPYQGLSVMKYALYMPRSPGSRHISDPRNIFRACNIMKITCIPCCNWKNWSASLDLIAGASAIIGPHGAGLANILYAQPGATLVQFDNTNIGRVWNPIFERMALANSNGQFTSIDLGAEPWLTVPLESALKGLEMVRRAM